MNTNIYWDFQICISVPLIFECCHAWGLSRITNSSNHKKICSANLIHAMQISKPLCHKLYSTTGYAGALHVPDSQLKPSCSRWNFRFLVNPQNLSKSPNEIEVLQTKVACELRNTWKVIRNSWKAAKYFSGKQILKGIN